MPVRIAMDNENRKGAGLSALNEEAVAGILGIRSHILRNYRIRGLVRPPQDSRSKEVAWGPEHIYKAYCLTTIHQDELRRHPADTPQSIFSHVSAAARRAFSSGDYFNHLSDNSWKEIVEKASGLGLEFLGTRYKPIPKVK